MGDKFLDSVQGLKELKIFQADEMQQDKMNKNAENFRKITMKVLVMQLASTTIMDLVAYGGAYFPNIFFAYFDTAIMDIGIIGTHASKTKAVLQSIHTQTKNKISGEIIAKKN